MATLSTNFNSALKIKDALFPMMDHYCKSEKRDVSELLKFDKNTIQDNMIMLEGYVNSDTQRDIPDLFIFAQEEQQNVENFMNHTNMVLSLGIAYVVLLFVLTLLLIIGVWLMLSKKSSSTSKRYNFCLNFFSMPLFVICIVCGYTAASFILLSGMLNAGMSPLLIDSFRFPSGGY